MHGIALQRISFCKENALLTHIRKCLSYILMLASQNDPLAIMDYAVVKRKHFSHIIRIRYSI